MAKDRIVVVEDSRLYRQVLKKTLVDAGYEVETAEDGKSGVELVSGLLPDLVITDMEMPVLCGEDLCRQLKAAAATQMIPIIMLTACQTTDKITQLDAGADDYIPKSQEFAELLAKVRVFLRIKHLQDQLREQNEKLRYENEMNERELRMAREVQMGLVPREGGRRGRLQVAFRYIPMLWVGGDLFDVVADADGGTVFFISDVAGHGVSAAFITAMIKTSVQGYTGGRISVTDLAIRVNNAISGLVGEGRFVTALFGMVDRDATKIQYVNAGHPPGMLIGRGNKTVRWLEPMDMPLGLVDAMEFSLQELPIEVGDRLILYTDGAIEALNSGDEQFGMTRFEESVLSGCGMDLDCQVEKVIKDLISFCGRESFDDDVNLVACEVIADER